MKNLDSSIKTMTSRIAWLLSSNSPSVYLYGSCTMEDFKPGWSDIDILVLTRTQIPEERARQLVSLRQSMLVEEPDNPYYRSFEGGMLTLDAFAAHDADGSVLGMRTLKFVVFAITSTSFALRCIYSIRDLQCKINSIDVKNCNIGMKLCERCYPEKRPPVVR